MIPLGRVPLLVMLGLIAAALVGLLFGELTPVAGAAATANLFIVAIELLLYLLAVVLSNSEIGGGRGLVIACGMVLTRWIVCLPTALMLTGVHQVPPSEAALLAWIGNPLAALIEAVIVMLVIPHVLQVLAPGLISARVQRILEGVPAPGPKTPAPPAGSPREAGLSVGGFLQVFSLPELHALFRKSVGMEGYVIFTSEGLIYWKDVPMRMDVELLVARVLPAVDAMAGAVERFGLSEVRRTLIESREHQLLVARLDGNFGLLMILAASARIDSAWVRLELMANTAREFLRWKYPGLGALRPVSLTPMTAGL